MNSCGRMTKAENFNAAQEKGMGSLLSREDNEMLWNTMSLVITLPIFIPRIFAIL